MMRLTLLAWGSLILSVGVGTFAQAQIDPPHDRQLQNSADIFGTLMTWYVQGTPIPYEQASGYFAGRCYYVNKRNHPTNTLLGVVQKRIPSNNGPAFPDTYVRKLIEVGVASASESYFDNYPASIAQWDIDRAEKYYGEIEDVGGTMVGTLRDESTLGLRVSGQYYVLAYNALKTGTLKPRGLTDPLPVQAGQVWMMCYYFKRLI